MSIDVYTYCGAFIRLFPASLEKIENYVGCGNTGCKAFGQENRNSFCGHCGQPVLQLQDSFTEDYSYQQWANDKDFVDYLISFVLTINGEEQTYLFPNNRNVSAKTAIFGGYDEGNAVVIDISKVDSDAMKAELVAAYADLLNALVESGFGYEILFGYFKGYS